MLVTVIVMGVRMYVGGLVILCLAMGNHANGTQPVLIMVYT